MKKLKILLVVVLFSGGVAFGQTKYKSLPSNIRQGDYSLDSINQELNAMRGSAVDLTKYLPENYVKDGSIDYTRYIQRGLNESRTVIFPNFPILVNEDGLVIKSNSNLVFDIKSKILLSPNNLDKYYIFKIYNAENVRIFNPQIIGDRKYHKGNSGEWGMGINIRSSKNIFVFNPIIEDCWGDGIVVSGFPNSPSSNIFIFNAYLDNNRRNGITVGSVKGLYIYEPVISNTNGTLPMSGIDIEPNGDTETINDVYIYNPVTFNNGKSGIQIGLSRLPSTKKKLVNIRIVNHTDMYSPNGLYIGGMKTSYGNNVIPLMGKIIIENPKWIDNEQPFKWGKNYDFSPVVSLRNLSVLKTNQGKLLPQPKLILDMKKRNQIRENIVFEN